MPVHRREEQLIQCSLFMIYSWLELHDEAHRAPRHIGAVGAAEGGGDDDRIRAGPVSSRSRATAMPPASVWIFALGTNVTIVAPGG